MTDTDLAPEIDHARIASHNDAFRRNVCLGIPYPSEGPALEGQLVCTAAVAARGARFVLACRSAVGLHKEFPEDADPNGLHEFGAIEVHDVPVWWKIDAYDRSYKWGSENPADPDQTARVLTILLPSDW